MYNLQVQVNKQTRMKRKSKNRGIAVAKALVPTDESWDAATVRKRLLDGRLV
ncbi:hypothetical protein QBC33DRAFT_538348 [Phialemonium atrogriseum]|uniref:Uncharacterized protein n=1 Tax=Phialemonium atrogriseum TaxID=1093897 RepID=A0AAJ0FNR9_9PEZI|nr:uncharacterized protein QBC33DRAFT_538348 [Phialemonium atrogriseum]KAK1767445.1 hypothetical protein QBC33DRAFT_538348 [Phialemonium atrogriseum]